VSNAFNDDEGRKYVISYGGRELRPCERKWPITQLECLSLLTGIREFHVYLAAAPFVVYTDHISLKYLESLKIFAYNRLARWSLARVVISVSTSRSRRLGLETYQRLVLVSSREKLSMSRSCLGLGQLRLVPKTNFFGQIVQATLTRCSAIAERPRCRVRYSFRQK